MCPYYTYRCCPLSSPPPSEQLLLLRFIQFGFIKKAGGAKSTKATAGVQSTRQVVPSGTGMTTQTKQTGATATGATGATTQGGTTQGGTTQGGNTTMGNEEVTVADN